MASFAGDNVGPNAEQAVVTVAVRQSDHDFAGKGWRTGDPLFYFDGESNELDTMADVFATLNERKLAEVDFTKIKFYAVASSATSGEYEGDKTSAMLEGMTTIHVDKRSANLSIGDHFKFEWAAGKTHPHLMKVDPGRPYDGEAMSAYNKGRPTVNAFFARH